MLRETVGSANQRQTWLFVLAEDGRVSQAILPIIDGVPVDADPRHIAEFAGMVSQLVAHVGAESVVVVWERPGSASVRMQEADWIAGLADSGAPIRAQAIASDDGVHLIDPAFAALTAV
jgi:hypothetical protein